MTQNDGGVHVRREEKQKRWWRRLGRGGSVKREARARPASETRCQRTNHAGARVNATAEYSSNASAHHALASRGAGLAAGTQ